MYGGYFINKTLITTILLIAVFLKIQKLVSRNNSTVCDAKVSGS